MSGTGRKVRAAIVGCGVIAPTHARALAIDGRAELVLACDPDLARARALGAARAADDWRAALESGIDLVIICTPHQLHAEQAVAALEAGKHVLCEKPLATAPADVARMLAAAEGARRRHGAVAAGVFQHRHSPLARRLRELLRAGDFGRVEGATVGFRCKRTRDYYASGPWRGRWDGEGGALMINQAIHSVDLAAWFCGEAVAVAGRVERRRMDTIECEDWAEGSVTFAGGARAELRCENDGATDWESRIEVRCGHGRFALGSDHRLAEVEHANEALAAELRALGALKSDGVSLPGPLPGKACYGDHHSLQVQDVLSAILAERQPQVSFADAAATNQLVLALYASAAAGGIQTSIPAPGFRRPRLQLAAAAATGG